MTGALAVLASYGAGSMQVTASPASLDASSSGAAASGGPITTAAASVTVLGGTAPYTYAVSKVSGSAPITITSPTGSSSTFSVATAFDGVFYEAFLKWTVTDANGLTAESSPVDVTIQWFDTR